MQTLLATRLEPDRRTWIIDCPVEPAIPAWPSGRMSPSFRGAVWSLLFLYTRAIPTPYTVISSVMRAQPSKPDARPSRARIVRAPHRVHGIGKAVQVMSILTSYQSCR